MSKKIQPTIVNLIVEILCLVTSLSLNQCVFLPFLFSHITTYVVLFLLIYKLFFKGFIKVFSRSFLPNSCHFPSYMWNKHCSEIFPIISILVSNTLNNGLSFDNSFFDWINFIHLHSSFSFSYFRLFLIIFSSFFVFSFLCCFCFL
jgi:hypothetical protein